MIYIAFIMIFLFIWTLISAVLLIFFNKNKATYKLKYLDEDFAAKDKLENEKKNKDNPIKAISKLMPSMKFNKTKSKKLEAELVKADLPITVEELLVIKLLSSAAISFLFYAISRNYIIIPLIIILVWNIPKIIIKKRKSSRIKQFDFELNEGIIVISNSLKAGYSFLQAVAVVSEEIPDPFSKEFKKLLKEMSLGISEEESLRNLMERMESEDLKLVVNAILIQKDIGGNLSEILDNIADTIRERQKIKNELKTLTAQGKLSGTIVIAIPIFLGAIIYVLNKDYMILLFTTPIGLGMVITSVISELLGVVIIKKIINIDM